MTTKDLVNVPCIFDVPNINSFLIKRSVPEFLQERLHITGLGRGAAYGIYCVDTLAGVSLHLSFAKMTDPAAPREIIREEFRSDNIIYAIEQTPEGTKYFISGKEVDEVTYRVYRERRTFPEVSPAKDF